jgi:hypothetical protein
MRELLPKPPGRYPLQLLHDIVRRNYRWSLDEQVNVVGHDFHAGYRYADEFGLLQKQLSQRDFHFTNQNLASILGTPYQVIADVVDRLVTGCPSRFAHVFYYSSG